MVGKYRKSEMKKLYIAIWSAILLCCGSINLQAQQNQEDTATVEVDLYIGDRVLISPCKGPAFAFLEVHRKTRTTQNLDQPGYDTLTGNGFFDWFFKEGDFDSQKLPCEYAGRMFPIVSIQTFLDKETKAPRDILFLRVDKQTFIWVEFYPAIEEGEIKLVP